MVSHAGQPSTVVTTASGSPSVGGRRRRIQQAIIALVIVGSFLVGTTVAHATGTGWKNYATQTGGFGAFCADVEGSIDASMYGWYSTAGNRVTYAYCQSLYTEPAQAFYNQLEIQKWNGTSWADCLQDDGSNGSATSTWYVIDSYYCGYGTYRVHAYGDVVLYTFASGSTNTTSVVG